MRWSKSLVRKEDSSSAVTDYKPPQVHLGSGEAANHYLQMKEHGHDFQISSTLEHKTGIDKIEKKKIETIAEQRALELLAEVQEKAYKEAYELGLQEGTQKAFSDTFPELEKKIVDFESFIQTLLKFKKSVADTQERQLIKLVYLMANKISYLKIQEQPEMIRDLIFEVIEKVSSEDEIQIRIHPQHLQFIKESLEKNQKSFEFLKEEKIKWNEDPALSLGGCIVETNYGEIDARIETRIEELWNILDQKAPQGKAKWAG